MTLIKTPFFAACWGAFLLLGGCGHPTGPVVSSLPEKTFELQGNDTMKYDVAAIDARAGQPCKLTLKNMGTMAKTAMAHNFVLVQLHTDVQAFANAGVTHGATDYIAPEQKTHIIAATKLLGPGESDTITFKAPDMSGNYDFLCTFPGHYAAGMKGTLVVYP